LSEKIGGRAGLAAGELSSGELAGVLESRGRQAIELRRAARLLTRGPVTFSRNVTIPVTRLCRNRCSYCSFRSERGGLLKWSEMLPTLKMAQDLGCCEVLFMAGERPEERYPRIRRSLVQMGFDSLAEYVAYLCGRILDETELLPHTNIGVVSRDELMALRKVNASVGLMLEDASPRLMERGMPHHRSPGKDPKIRLEMIEEAGRIRLPFTTGLLIGIGQTSEEIARSLLSIKKIQERYGHIQEVIIQRFQPKAQTSMQSYPPPPTDLVLNTVSLTRLLLPDTPVQVPPNIETRFEAFLLSGANDLGGISPLTVDYINPDCRWPSEEEIFKRTRAVGLQLKARPPVYPSHINGEFLVPRVLARARRWAKAMESPTEGS